MYTPSSIFLCQTTLDKAKFLEFGTKNAKLATRNTSVLTITNKVQNCDNNSRN